MKKLINFLKLEYPTVDKNKIQVSLLTRNERYCAIAVAKNNTLNLMDKFIYESSKGNYIRVLTRPNRYMRVYLHEFETCKGCPSVSVKSF